MSLGATAGHPWLCGTSSHGCESTPCSRLCHLWWWECWHCRWLCPLVLEQLPSTSSRWMGAWIAGEMRGRAPKRLPLPSAPAAVPSPAPLSGGAHSSLPTRPWMLLGVDSAGWLWGSGFAQLARWFSAFPDVTFSLLCLFSSALLPLAHPQERLLWLIDLMEVGAAGAGSVCVGRGRAGLAGECCGSCTATSCHPSLLSSRGSAEESSFPRSLVLQCTQGSA